MKKRILFATAYNANDTTSYLRAWGPFTLLQKMYPGDIEIIEPRLIQYDTNGAKLEGRWWKDWTNWFNNILSTTHY